MRAVGFVSIFLLISLASASPRIVKRETGRSWGENDASSHKLARQSPEDQEKPHPTNKPSINKQDLRGRNAGPSSNMPAMDPRARMAMMMQAAQMAQMAQQAQGGDNRQGAPRPQYGRPSGMPQMGMPPQYGSQQPPMGMPPMMGMPPQYGSSQQGPMNGMPQMPMSGRNFTNGQRPSPMEMMMLMRQQQAMMAMARMQQQQQGNGGSAEQFSTNQPTHEQFERMMMLRQQAMMAAQQAARGESPNTGSSDSKDSGTDADANVQGRMSISDFLEKVRGDGSASNNEMVQGPVTQDPRMMQGSMMQDPRMQGGMMQDPRMQGAMMQDPRMQAYMMQDPRMQGAMMQDPRMMQGSMMQDPSMQGAMMQDPSMQTAMMQDPRMQGYMMQDPRMQGSSMQGSTMQDPRMQAYMMQDPRMQGAMMQDPRMQGAMMQDPRLMQGSMMQDPSMQGAMMQDPSQMYGGVAGLTRATPPQRQQPIMSDGTMHPLTGEQLKTMDLSPVNPMTQMQGLQMQGPQMQGLQMQGPGATPMPKLQAVMGVDSRLEQFRQALIKSFYMDLFRFQAISEQFKSQMKYKLALLRQIEARMTTPLRAAIASDVSGGGLFPQDAQSSIIITKLHANQEGTSPEDEATQ